ncbi:MAG: glycine--tRNA ligase subunit beta [Elusimicrobiota bacterium]
MSKDILLEIGTEEIPAGYLPSVIEQLSTIAEKELKTFRLDVAGLCKNINPVSYTGCKSGVNPALSKDQRKIWVNVWATPRRLILYCENVAEQQTARETEISGPPSKVAFVNSKPTPAAFGFAKKYGVDVSELIVKNDKVYVLKKETSLSTEAVLPEVFRKIISAITFPKTMVWESSRFRFVRPIRWILSLYGKKTIKFQIADVQSSNWTSIRYCKKLKITEPKKFVDILRNKSVIVKQSDRLEMLKKTVMSAIKNTGEISENEDVFETVNNMVEFPTAILCKFDKKFLNLSPAATLPEEIIINTVKKQKNFVVVDEKTKKVLTYFVGVKDGISTNIESIRDGYEKVIAARLEDAEFYFINDTKTKLEEKVERLKGIVFQEKLGTIYDKVLRIQKLSIWLSNNISTFQHSNIPTFQHSNIPTLERLCVLCKADLVTETVSEFPELQGVFGKICATKDGENKTVADGIEQHWWPIKYEGKIPDSIEASVVSIADKIDTLVGDFAIGLTPTGSADPYGLRRAAFGIVRIVIEKKVSFSLKELIIQAITNLPIKVDDNMKIISQLDDFLSQRLDTYLKEKDILQDEIDAVFSGNLVDILDTYNRVVGLHSIRKFPDFEPIATSFKRIGNILRQAGEKGRESEIKEELLEEPEEKELYQKFLDVKNKIEKETEKNNYGTVLQDMVVLRKPIDNFFDKVLIMDKDEKVKNNRLSLLSAIYEQFKKIADFSKINAT